MSVLKKRKCINSAINDKLWFRKAIEIREDEEEKFTRRRDFTKSDSCRKRVYKIFSQKDVKRKVRPIDDGDGAQTARLSERVYFSWTMLKPHCAGGNSLYVQGRSFILYKSQRGSATQSDVGRKEFVLETETRSPNTKKKSWYGPEYSTENLWSILFLDRDMQPIYLFGMTENVRGGHLCRNFAFLNHNLS